MKPLIYTSVVALLCFTIFLGYRTKSQAEVFRNIGEPTPTKDGKMENLLAVLSNNEIRRSDPKSLKESIQEAGRIVQQSCGPESEIDQTKTGKQCTELLYVLIPLLDWEQPKSNSEFDQSYGMPVYPAIYSIVKFGRSALAPMIEILESESEDSIRFKNALSSIRFIYDRDDTLTINYLRVQAAVAKGEVEKKRLLAAADLVSEEQKKFQNRINQ